MVSMASDAKLSGENAAAVDAASAAVGAYDAAPAAPRTGAPLRLSAAQKRILGYISARTTLEGGVCCSKKELSKQADCSVQTVDRAVAHLRKLGLIDVDPIHGDTGAQMANRYRARR